MPKLIAMPLVLFAMFFAGVRSHADENAHQLEFRIADTEPSPKWTRKEVPGQDQPVFVSEKVVLTGADIAKVSFYHNAQGHPTIEFTFTEAAAARMAKVTSENIRKRLAILLDGEIVSAPIINAQIRKEAVISGRFGRKDLTRFFEAVVLFRYPAEKS